jgi:hypothetical protein
MTETAEMRTKETIVAARGRLEGTDTDHEALQETETDAGRRPDEMGEMYEEIQGRRLEDETHDRRLDVSGIWIHEEIETHVHVHRLDVPYTPALRPPQVLKRAC